MLVTVKLRGQTTANVCAVLEIHDLDGRDGLKLSVVQYAPMPGGQLKFCVVCDEVSQLFWATANVAVDSQRMFDWREIGRDPVKDSKNDHKNASNNNPDNDPGKVSPPLPGGDDRRFLLLFYGLD